MVRTRPATARGLRRKRARPLDGVGGPGPGRSHGYAG